MVSLLRSSEFIKVAVGPVLGGCQGIAFFPEFSYGRRVRGSLWS